MAFRVFYFTQIKRLLIVQYKIYSRMEENNFKRISKEDNCKKSKYWSMALVI